MINTLKPVLIAGVFMASITTASASTMDHAAGMIMENFETITPFNIITAASKGTDDEIAVTHLNGWRTGDRSADDGKEASQPHLITEDSGNKYFEIKSTGKSRGSSANPRMAFYNNTTVAGDYSEVFSISADFKATSIDGDLFMRLNFEAHDGKFYSSKEAQVLSNDNEWATLTFIMTADDFLSGEYGDEFEAVSEETFAEAIKAIHEIKIVSNEEYAQWAGVDRIDATVGMDNFQTHAAVSAVPVPAAAWLMISGLLGLGAFSSKNRKA